MNSLDTFDRSPYRSPDGALTPAGIRGRIVFQESACIDCHEGEDFSDSDSGLLHDVGTIQPHSGNRLGAPLLGIDTPTLRGIWQSDPYLHDGSAPTLDDLLSAPSGLHSVQKSLALEDYEDLVAYLLQIDGAEPAAPSSALFRDGFEGGTTAAWSGVSP
jgi:cytochrome c peroxidase